MLRFIKNFHQSKGFALLELLAVAAILSVLAAAVLLNANRPGRASDHRLPNDASRLLEMTWQSR